MSTEIMGQVELAKSLNEMLSQINSKMNAYASSARDQATYASQVTESFRQSAQTYEKITSSSQNISKTVLQFSTQIEKSLNNNKVVNYFDEYSKSMENVKEKYESASQASKDLTDAADDAGKAATENIKSFDAAFKSNKEGLEKLYKANKTNLNSLSKMNSSLGELTKSHNEFVKKSEEAASASNKFAKALKMATVGAIGFLKILGSMVGLLSNFFKTAMTLPFMVLDRVAKLGNALRQDIVVTIGQAAEDSKEFFDSLSSIGRGIKRVANIGIGMLKTFENYNSSAVKLFGEGASGIANMVKETTESIKNMGHYSEYFAQTITKNKEALFHYTRIKRIMGLTAEQEAYYAQDAGIQLRNVSSLVGEIAIKANEVGKEYGIDSKRLMLNFNKLRVDIALFSHLSNDELLGMTARLTQMKVSVEDAANVFKKFNTFEDAANSVAMLSQTFGMNLDAMDIIQANSPEDIINMFRDGMIATGRTFDELNRFEKGILADQTGMTQESLKALMTLRDKGLTHSEAVNAMKDQTPEAQQLKAIKELSSAMKMLQKVMNFSSPFEAFLKGLGKNSAASKSARKAFMSLSNTYQMIHDFALNLDKDTVDALTEPVILIVNIMRDIFNSSAFKGGLVSLVQSFGDIATYAFGITDVDKIYYEVRESVLNRDKSKNAQFVTDLNNMEKSFAAGSKAKELYTEYKKKYKGKVSGDMFLSFLKEFRRQGVNNPQINAEYEKLAKEFGDKYKFSSLDRVESNADGSYMVSTVEDRLKNSLDANSDNFAKFFDLSGSVMGGIIKGAGIFLAAGLNTITDILKNSGEMSLVDQGKTFFESFFDWQPGELDQLLDEVISAFTGLLTQTDKITSIGGWFLGQFADLTAALAETFWFALKGVGRRILPGFFGKMSISDVLYNKKVGKKGFTERDMIKKQRGRGGVDAGSFDASDQASQESFALKLGNVQALATPGSEIAKAAKNLESKAIRDDIGQEDYKLLTMLQAVAGYDDITPAAMSAFADTDEGRRKRKKRMNAFDQFIYSQFIRQANSSQVLYDHVEEALNKDKNSFIHPKIKDSYLNMLSNYAQGVGRIVNADSFEDIGIDRNNSTYLQEAARFMKNSAAYSSDSDKNFMATQVHALVGESISTVISQLEKTNPNIPSQVSTANTIISGLDGQYYNRRLDENGLGFMKAFMNFYPERSALLQDREIVQDAMVAKPGGAIDTIFNNLKSMTGSATQASSNITSLFDENKVVANTGSIEEEHAAASKKFDELKEIAKSKKNEVVVQLEKLAHDLIKNGNLRSSLSRHDIVSRDTLYFSGESTNSSSGQDGRPSVFASDPYPEGELG